MVFLHEDETLKSEPKPEKIKEESKEKESLIGEQELGEIHSKMTPIEDPEESITFESATYDLGEMIDIVSSIFKAPVTMYHLTSWSHYYVHFRGPYGYLSS